MSLKENLTCAIDDTLAECQEGREIEALQSLLAQMKNNLPDSASEEEVERIFHEVAQSRNHPIRH